MLRVTNWFFRNRQTGEITVAQAPNLLLWIVIVSATLRWIRPLPRTLDVPLNTILTGGLIIWAADEILRGVNPWRRCLGTIVGAYGLATMALSI